MIHLDVSAHVSALAVVAPAPVAASSAPTRRESIASAAKLLVLLVAQLYARAAGTSIGGRWDASLS